MYAGRLVTLFLIFKTVTILIAIISTYLFYPYTENTNLLLQLEAPANAVDDIVRNVLSPFARWDAVYFLRIADSGYQYEQQHAFFPLFPALLRLGAKVFERIGLSIPTGCMLTGFIISNLAHFFTMVNTFKLSMTLGAEEYFAFVASAFVIASPAYIFQSAIYSESLFSLLATTGMLAFYRRQRVLAAICFCLTGVTRSNGITLAGFFLYDTWTHVLGGCQSILVIMKDLILFLSSLSGYVGFQYYGYMVYCGAESTRPWCYNNIPDLYSFVQKHYWNVGFLKYYTLGQLPNFLIATPMILFTLTACWSYFRSDWKRSLTLGGLHEKHRADPGFLHQDVLFPHFVLLLTLLIYTLCIVHVQIIARLFSFQPVIYWSLAHFYTVGTQRSFSAVVGPNGSGKSNVIDAVMFVLGYRAKKMRQAKLADLIHVSEGMTSMDSCTVEIHFCRIIDREDDGYESVPGTELVVARTAWRNSRNVYTVNGTSSNYEGVTSLLKAQGIDLDHKRFLILQGEVEAIAMMKAKGANEHEEGLLEYLEDIIGTNQYIEKIEIAGKDLDLANEEHASMFLRVKAKEKECNALIGEKEEAESYLRQENTRTERRNELLQTLIWQNQRDLIKLEARVVEKRARLEEERTKNSTDAAQADEIEAAIKSATKNATELEKKVRKLQSELTALEQADVKMQETRKQLKNKLKILSKTSNDSAKQEGEMARGIEDTSTSIAHLTKELSEKRQELEIASAELDRISTSLKGVTVKHQKSLDVKQAALIPFQDQLRILQRSLDLARVSLDTLETKSNAGAKEQSKLNERLEQILGEFGETETKMTNLEKQKKDLSKKTTVHRENINNLEVDRAARSKELAMLQATAAEAMAAMSQNESGSAVLKALMRESRSGAIRGIHGRLGDLGVIDGKYDAAIATSCSYLDHIVVDTTEVGQICIEHLRRNNIGRANFIVLDKMRPAVKEASSLPLGAKRLFDLVKLKDTRFTDAMYFALTDTLVAPSLEQAQQWAYGTKRWRVVTLDGKLFETSGTVSGGGQVRRGGMGTQFKGDATITADQVRMLQDKVKEAQDELKQLIAMIGKEQTALASIEEQILRIEGEASFLNGQRGSLVVEKEMIQQKRATLSNTNISALSKDEQAEAKHLGKEIGQLQAQIAQVKKEMSPIEREIDAIQQQILDAGGMKYKVQRSKVDGLTEQIKNNESRLSDLEKEKLTLERRLANARAGQKDETAIAKVENELLELDGKLQAATHTAIELTQEFTQLQTDLDQRNDQVEQLKEKLDTLSKAVVSFRKMEYELRCAIESDEEQIVISQKAITNCTTDLKQLKLHQIETSQAVPVLSIYEDEKDLADFARNLSQIKTTIEALSEKLERSRPNLKVLEEYRQKESALCEQQAELASVEGKRDTVRTNYEGLCRRRHEEFMAGFREIGNRLKEMYQLITLGGNAELELVDSLDPFAEGVLFSVMPPRKSWKNISNLSGGEKTLSSLALVFALHAYRPTPIYIMDEIDAALDFRNVSIVAHYIKERTRDAQFIVVSLRNNMFELADRLVGIYKTYQRTKSVTIDPGQYQLSPVNS